MPLRQSSVALALLALATNPAYAGELAGRVLDSTGHRALGAARVVLPDLGRSVSTGADGQFLLVDVPAGDHRLAVQYLGAPPAQRLVTVPAVGRVTLDLPLVDDTAPLETLTVYGQATSMASALNRQRDALALRNFVTASDIGELPDGNVSEALQRVPGVFLERDQGEGRYVGVRGLDPNLNAATVNGVSLPSPERDRRSVALDIIPAELLESLEVSKSLTPDMDGDAIGGSINIRSAGPFDRASGGLAVRTEANVNDLDGDRGRKVSVAFSDAWDLATGGRFGAAASVSWGQRAFGSDNIETDGGWQALETVAGETFRGAEEIELRDYAIERERRGAVVNLEWRPDEGQRWFLNTLYSYYSDQELRTREEFKFDKGDAVVGTAGTAEWQDARLQRELKDRLETQQVLSIALGGSWAPGAWDLAWQAAWSAASETEPDRIDTQFELRDVTLGYRGIGETPVLFAGPRALDPLAFALDEIAIEDNDTEDRERAWRIDVTRHLDRIGMGVDLRAGAKVRLRRKVDDVNVRVFDGFPGDPDLSTFLAAAPDHGDGDLGSGVSEAAIDSLVTGSLAGFDLDTEETLIASAVADYRSSEDVYAAYAAVEVDRGPLSGVVGARWELTRFATRGTRVDIDDATDGGPQIVAVAGARQYGHWLPSVNLRWEVSERTLVRAAWFRSLSRPNFAQSAAGGELELEDDGGAVELSAELGNPDLRPLRADSFDLAVEHYADGLGMLAAGVFWKRIDDFVAETDTAGLLSSAQLAALAGGLQVTDAEVVQPVNGERADLLGAEVTFTHHFDRLPGAWSGLLVSANATVVRSRARLAQRPGTTDLPRQPGHVANLVVGWEGERLSSRIALSRRGRALLVLHDLEDPAGDEFQSPHTQVDASLKWRFARHWVLDVSAINLTDEPFYSYFGEHRYNAIHERYGRTLAIGLHYRGGR